MGDVRLLAAALLVLIAFPARGVDVPPEGACPPHALRLGEDPPVEGDVAPPLLRSGEVIPMASAERLANFLPREVWERRRVFFFEGMALEVGPCYRRYPVPPFFREATEANRGKTRVDAKGNLLGYAGRGLPFAPDTVDAAPDAAARWAWNHRYRYQGSGFRGDFRIRHVSRRGQKVEVFEGRFFMLPLQGVPGLPEDGGRAFVAGGSFRRPELSRGLSWRQFRSAEADAAFDRTDDVFVWLPDDRKVRRAAGALAEGIYLPSYTRGSGLGNEIFSLPDGQISGMNTGIAATEPMRKGFVGLVIRPNAWTWRIHGTADVLAPINVRELGFPADKERSYGPSGLSMAHDRWDVRRAVVLSGRSRKSDGQIASLRLWVDALTLQPLYLVTRRPNLGIVEVGIFVGRFSADDPAMTRWEGGGEDFGAILPVAQTFFVAGDEGWTRESFDLAFDPPDPETYRRLVSTKRLQRGH